MVALEAGLVVGYPVSGELVHEVNSLVTDPALLQRSREGHFPPLVSYTPVNRTTRQPPKSHSSAPPADPHLQPTGSGLPTERIADLEQNRRLWWLE